MVNQGDVTTSRAPDILNDRLGSTKVTEYE